MRQALSLREEDSDFWNLLGLVYSLQSKPGSIFAQKCEDVPLLFYIKVLIFLEISSINPKVQSLRWKSA